MPLPVTAERTELFGTVLTNKSEFEISLHRTQTAILNPHLSHDTFLQKTVQELKDIAQSDSSLKFSKNVLCVDIEDPRATDLMFSGLPGNRIIYFYWQCLLMVSVAGLIQNETQTVIDLVRSLVQDYIGRPRTLTLVTIGVSLRIVHQT
jgi:hypothetical protein